MTDDAPATVATETKPAQIRTYREIVAAYARMGKAAISGKGGVWVMGEGFRPFQTALKETRGYRSWQR